MRVNCFACFGHGFQSAQLCGVCNGTGHIDTEMVCECGRPATEYEGDTIVCINEACHSKAIANAHVKANVRRLTTRVDPVDPLEVGDNLQQTYCHCAMIPGIHTEYECRMKAYCEDWPMAGEQMMRVH